VYQVGYYLLNPPLRHPEGVRNLRGSQVLFAPGKALYHLMSDSQAQKLSIMRDHQRRIRPRLVDTNVLDCKGNLRTEKNDHPADIKPDKEEGKGGKTAVDGIVFRHPDLKVDVCHLC